MNHPSGRRGPDYPVGRRVILKTAITVENETGRPWTWSQVQAHPMTLMGFVVAGLVEVVGRAGHANLYKVTAAGRATWPSLTGVSNVHPA